MWTCKRLNLDVRKPNFQNILTLQASVEQLFDMDREEVQDQKVARYDPH